MQTFYEYRNAILPQSKMVSYWDLSLVEKYKKVGKTPARLADEGEQIDTVIDGKQETTNTAKDGDVVVKGPKQELYILSNEKFAKRYVGPSLTNNFQDYEPIGEAYAMEWTHVPVSFNASWGERMIIENGDMLCSPTKIPDGDLYRIEKDVFRRTYQQISDK